MKTYQETFKDQIDMTDGTAVIDEKIYKKIQLDALKHILKIVDKEYVECFVDNLKVIGDDTDKQIAMANK